LQYKEYKPSKLLEPYVKCYYTIAYSGDAIVEDKAFATGCIELMFTLYGSQWQIKTGEGYAATTPVEVWGQILQPLAFRNTGYAEIFGIRFYPATAAYFLQGDISDFNDRVFDLEGVAGGTITELHAKLQDAQTIACRIALTENYLLKQAERRPKVIGKINLVKQVMTDLAQKDFFDNINNVAAQYGITSRYLQKLFLQHTGLTPKLYVKINRFQNSLMLMGKGDLSLTEVAYASGYFDQSHFIREFKTFTGFSPSGFNMQSSAIVMATQ
jgi:AraC-like DNA-binding protein